MWLCDLLHEAWHWTKGKSDYSVPLHKAKLKLSVFFCFVTVVSLVSVIVQRGQNETAWRVIQIQFICVLGCDFLVYVFRIYTLCRGSEERNVVRLVHIGFHLLIISCWVQLLVYQIQHNENHENKLFVPLPVLGVRVLAYSIVTLVIVVASPCFLHKMVTNWRNRHFYIPPASQSQNREALLRQYEEFVQLREEFMRRLQAEYGIQINDDFPDRIDDFLNNQEGSGFENFNALKKVQYEDIKDELTFEECPI